MKLKQLVKQPDKKIFNVTYYVAQTGNKLNNVNNRHENTSYYESNNLILSKTEFQPKSGTNRTKKLLLRFWIETLEVWLKTLPLATNYGGVV